VIVLGIETSTARSSVALLRDDTLMAHEQHEDARGHGAFLAPAMRRCLAALDAPSGPDAGVGIDLVAVGTGPGLYTGLRVGLATASAFASARVVPIVGVGGMDALALGSGVTDRCIVTTLDARRGQVFWAVHAPDVVGPHGPELRCSEGPTVGTREELDAVVRALAVDGPVQVVGEVASDVLLRPDAADTARLALRRVAAGSPAAGPLEPVYLRDADVRIGWNERGGVRVGGA
jgi:tRNA threonylcarbamoyladenosine biosynthesis protein TsaB